MFDFRLSDGGDRLFVHTAPVPAIRLVRPFVSRLHLRRVTSTTSLLGQQRRSNGFGQIAQFRLGQKLFRRFRQLKRSFSLFVVVVVRLRTRFTSNRTASMLQQSSAKRQMETTIFIMIEPKTNDENRKFRFRFILMGTRENAGASCSCVAFPSRVSGDLRRVAPRIWSFGRNFVFRNVK